MNHLPCSRKKKCWRHLHAFSSGDMWLWILCKPTLPNRFPSSSFSCQCPCGCICVVKRHILENERKKGEFIVEYMFENLFYTAATMDARTLRLSGILHSRSRIFVNVVVVIDIYIVARTPKIFMFPKHWLGHPQNDLCYV